MGSRRGSDSVGRRQWLAAMVVVGLGLFAIGAPTSVAGEERRLLTLTSLVVPCLAFVVLVAQGHVAGSVELANVVVLFGLLLLFTITSPFQAMSWGIVGLYICLGLLYLVDVRAMRADVPCRRVLVAISAGILAGGALVIMRVAWFQAILVRSYTAYYPDLVRMMVVGLRKPVFTFATHSMAAFIYYMLFWLNLVQVREKNRFLHLVLAVGLLAVEVALTSTTAVILGTVGLIQLLGVMTRRHKWVLVPIAVVAVAALLYAVGRGTLDLGSMASRVEASFVGSGESGLLARYSQQGVLAGNIHYVLEGGLPVGWTYSSQLFFGDSGFLVYLVRGSALMVLSVYCGLFLFLRRNLVARRDALVLFLVTIAFEIGFTPLLNWRFVGLLPFIVVCANSARSAPVGPGHGGAV